MKGDQELDGATYEFFVRRIFNCERDDEQYPFADNRAWMALVYRKEWADKEIETTPSKHDKRKEYDKYFKQMVKDLEKTITHAQSRFQKVESAHQFIQLESDLAKAQTLEDLRKLVSTGSELLDTLNIKLT